MKTSPREFTLFCLGGYFLEGWVQYRPRQGDVLK